MRTWTMRLAEMQKLSSTKAAAHPPGSSHGALFSQRSTHQRIRRLSPFRLSLCSSRDGTFKAALPGGIGGRSGVKSRATRASYVIRTRVTPGTLVRMIGHQNFDRVSRSGVEEVG